MPRKPNTTKDHYYDPFPKKLRKLVEAGNLIQDDLTEVLGVKSRQSVTGYLDGSTIPTADKIVNIAKFFDVSADYLLGLSDDPHYTAEAAAAAAYLGLKDYQARKLKAIISPAPRRDIAQNMIKNGTLEKIIDALVWTSIEIQKLEDELTAENVMKIKAQARHVQRDLGDDLAAILSDLTGKGLLDYKTGKLEEENRQRDALEAAAENYADILLDLEVSDNGEHQED